MFLRFFGIVQGCSQSIRTLFVSPLPQIFCKVFKVICQQAAQRDPELTLAARWLGDHYGIVEWAEHLGCFGNLCG